MDENDEEEIRRLVRDVKRHSMFVPEQENFDIDGIPDRIEHKSRDGDDFNLRKEIDKLKEVANQHSDYDLERLASKMKQRL
jgi:hypothetical protein